MSILIHGLLAISIALVYVLTTGPLGLAVGALIALLVGSIAEWVAPRQLPIGWPGALIAGLAGCWLGGWFLSEFGPQLGGLALIPALFGAVNARLLVAAVWSWWPKDTATHDIN